MLTVAEAAQAALRARAGPDSSALLTGLSQSRYTAGCSPGSFHQGCSGINCVMNFEQVPGSEYSRHRQGCIHLSTDPSPLACACFASKGLSLFLSLQDGLRSCFPRTSRTRAPGSVCPLWVTLASDLQMRKYKPQPLPPEVGHHLSCDSCSRDPEG